MPETPQLPRTDDPLAALRAGVDAHARIVEGQRQTAAELQQLPQLDLAPATGEVAA